MQFFGAGSTLSLLATKTGFSIGFWVTFLWGATIVGVPFSNFCTTRWSPMRSRNPSKPLNERT